MQPAAHVLIVSRDPMLLQTRKLILGTYFQVEAAGRLSEAEAIIAKNYLDLVVLCYSLSPDECQRIVSLVSRQKPRPKILALSVLGALPFNVTPDQQMRSEDGPYALLKKSAEMLAFELKIRGRVAHA